MSSTRPVINYPPGLRERAIRMVAEVRGEYPSDWAAAQSVAAKLGIGTPQTLMKPGPQGAGRRRAAAGCHQYGGRGVAAAARRVAAAAHGERDIAHGEHVFRRGGARPPTGLIVDYINRHRRMYGVAPTTFNTDPAFSRELRNKVTGHAGAFQPSEPLRSSDRPIPRGMAGVIHTRAAIILHFCAICAPCS
jgi:hypothetical protein